MTIVAPGNISVGGLHLHEDTGEYWMGVTLTLLDGKQVTFYPTLAFSERELTKLQAITPHESTTP